MQIIEFLIVVFLGASFVGQRTRIKALKMKVANLEILATHDPLTGALNRRGGEEVISHHLSLLARDNAADNCFAIVTLDLDKFKAVNDTHGHAVGDMVLRFVVQMLSSCLRKEHDKIVRTGGDEFYIIAPKCGHDGARAICEKIKKTFDTTRFVDENMELELELSVSLGVSVSHDAGKLKDLQALFATADSELYLEKRQRQ